MYQGKLPKNEDPSLVNRNKGMLGQLLGILETFKVIKNAIDGQSNLLLQASVMKSTVLGSHEHRFKSDAYSLMQKHTCSYRNALPLRIGNAGIGIT
ncbi:hypothetical protein PIB30_075044, partial [Stylosanthes scabra]|nr:hypothetical protein [Stylosanthes scabra]